MTTRKTPGATPQTISALQTALAAEQAASFGYTIVGAHLKTQQPRATSDWIAHQKARDTLTRLLRQRHSEPPPAPVSYAIPHPVTTPAQAATLAIDLEQKVTAAYLPLVAVTDRELRTLAAGQMRAATLRAISWGAAPTAFPGYPSAALQNTRS
jgi:Domain of unknown function (DUF4439)